MTSSDSVHDTIQKMVRTCFGNLNESISPNTPISIYQTNVKRIDRTFREVAKKLQSEGKGFVKEDGLRLFINSKQDLKQFHY